MRRTFKYELETKGEQIINVPQLGGANSFIEQVLKIDVQHEKLCIWCLVDEELPKIDRKILIYGTGQPLPVFITKKDYLGTYQLVNGDFIGHIFLEQ